jgi:hypothetical protein
VTSLVIRAFLYDVADHDREIDATTGTLPALADHQLLWLDVTGRDIGDLSRVAELLVLKPQVAHDMTQSGRTFTLVNYGDYVHFEWRLCIMTAPSPDRPSLPARRGSISRSARHGC